eukprot:g19160.t1
MAASSDSELWAIELDAQGESQQLDPRDGRVEAKDTSFLTDASCCETKGKDKEENAIYCCRKQENGNADGGVGSGTRWGLGPQAAAPDPGTRRANDWPRRMGRERVEEREGGKKGGKSGRRRRRRWALGIHPTSGQLTGVPRGFQWPFVFDGRVTAVEAGAFLFLAQYGPAVAVRGAQGPR